MNESRRYRLGVMGGTFDPIHLGHLACASEVAYRLALDEVVFVPAGLPWQKSGRRVSPAADRYAMTDLATAPDPRFSASRVEIDRDGPSYTRDTLLDLRAARPDAELFFIAGADALAGLPTWRYADELLSLATFVGANRPGYAAETTALGGSVTLVDIPALDISSSDCRLRVARGAPITYLVPADVIAYIDQRRLYRDGEDD